jgi:hypothetical protein
MKDTVFDLMTKMYSEITVGLDSMDKKLEVLETKVDNISQKY